MIVHTQGRSPAAPCDGHSCARSTQFGHVLRAQHAASGCKVYASTSLCLCIHKVRYQYQCRSTMWQMSELKPDMREASPAVMQQPHSSSCLSTRPKQSAHFAACAHCAGDRACSACGCLQVTFSSSCRHIRCQWRRCSTASEMILPRSRSSECSSHLMAAKCLTDLAGVQSSLGNKAELDAKVGTPVPSCSL